MNTLVEIIKLRAEVENLWEEVKKLRELIQMQTKLNNKLIKIIENLKEN